MCVASLLKPHEVPLIPEPWLLLQALELPSPHLFRGNLLGSPQVLPLPTYQEWIPSAPGQ